MAPTLDMCRKRFKDVAQTDGPSVLRMHIKPHRFPPFHNPMHSRMSQAVLFRAKGHCLTS